MARSCMVAAAAEGLYPFHEPEVVAGHRRRLLQRATGPTLDISTHWTRNRACLRAGAVTSLTVTGTTGAGVGRDGGPEVLATGGPPDGRFETVVSATTLCCADDLGLELDSLRRWLRPRGQLLVLEHVRGVGLTGLAQRALTPFGRRAGTTCRLDMDLPDALRRAGFELTDAARFSDRLAGGVPVPYLAAIARTRPAVSRPVPRVRRVGVPSGGTP